MLKEFFETLKTYKEGLLAVAAVMAAIFFVRDYFATKEDVKILKCQADSGIEILEGRMNEERLSRRLVSLRLEIDDAKRKAGLVRVRNTELETATHLLMLEQEKHVRELIAERDKQKQAAAKLKPGACEQNVRGK